MSKFKFWYESWPLDLQIAFLLSPFIIGLIGIGIGIHIACTSHFHDMISALKNSKWPQMVRNTLGDKDFMSRCFLVSSIGGAFLFARWNERRGVLDSKDIEDFPKKLWYRLITSTWLVIFSMIWMSIMIALIELSDAK